MFQICDLFPCVSATDFSLAERQHNRSVAEQEILATTGEILILGNILATEIDIGNALRHLGGFV